jgi:hypothetical protein
MLLSIGQNPRGINQARQSRSTKVEVHLNATTAPIRRRGVVAFRGTEDRGRFKRAADQRISRSMIS